jgi:hypothetical protein
LLGQWDKQIIDQESDVPNIICFHTFYRLSALKTLDFYFCNFIKKIRNEFKGFLQRILQEIVKKIILGTSDAWSTIRLSKSKQPSVLYCKLTDFYYLNSDLLGNYDLVIPTHEFDSYLYKKLIAVLKKTRPSISS